MSSKRKLTVNRAETDEIVHIHLIKEPYYNRIRIEFTIEKNCLYRYNDLSDHRNISSPEMCAAECGKTINCTHAAYNGRNKICLLKHASSKEQIQGTRLKLNNVWCITYNGEDRFGVAAATTTLQPISTTTEDAVSKNFVINESCDYRGSDLSSLENISSARECAANCYKTQR
uniref:Apple domain-containing protein n=1 Tax=Romanomermis culicivorax TaxID=13658 RepID=A0A915IZ65_ROMCU